MGRERSLVNMDRLDSIVCFTNGTHSRRYAPLPVVDQRHDTTRTRHDTTHANACVRVWVGGSSSGGQPDIDATFSNERNKPWLTSMLSNKPIRVPFPLRSSFFFVFHFRSFPFFALHSFSFFILVLFHISFFLVWCRWW